jgi:carboxypeptidase family protein/TonB-dependent receptor-like protein
VNKYVWLAAVLLSVWTCVPGAHAQVGGKLEGVVTDSSKAIVPGATVTITNADTGSSRETKTNAQGHFAFNALPPSRYDLSVTMDGFKSLHREGITVTIGSELALDLALEVGTVTEQVTVTGEAPLVETQSGTISGVVEEKMIREIPLNGRSFTDLIQLQPGVVLTRAGGQSTTAGTGQKMSLGGARPFQMSFYLDGADMMGKDNTNPAGASGLLLGVDSIQEFRVTTSAFSAEFGRNAGGVVSAITKSGTNQLHGTAFEFLRNDNVDAARWQDNQSPFGKPNFVRNQFGGTVGGPILRNKTFFFGSYEGLRDRTGSSGQDNVPNAAARDGILPTKTVNVLAAVKQYLAIYPLPNGPDLGGGIGRYFRPSFNNTNQNDFMIRIDHQLSDSDMLMGRVFFDDGLNTSSGSLGLITGDTKSRIQSYVASYKKIIGAAMVNDARMAYTRTNLDLSVDIPDSLNALAFVPGQRFGIINPTGLATISGISSGTPRTWTDNVFQYIDDMVITHGSHTFKMGGMLERFRYNGISIARAGGEYDFTGLETFLTGTTSKFWAGFGLGGTRGMRQWLFGTYFQDDYRVSSKLTLNLGVRYEGVTSPGEVKGRISNLRNQLDANMTVGNPFVQNPSLKNFAPRVGFAYDPKGDAKTAIRGGVGLFYDQLLPIYYRDNVFRVIPYQQQFTLVPQTTPNIPFPNAVTLTVPDFNKLNGPDVQIDLANWDPRQPYTMQYNLTVQRQVQSDLSVMVGYMGSFSRHNSRNINWNTSFPTAVINGENCWSVPPTLNSSGVVTAPASACWNGSSAALPRRNPNFAQVLQRMMDSNSNYNSLQVAVKKRYAHGLDLSLVYQFAKTLDEQSGIGGSTDFGNVTSFTMDPENRSRDYGRAAFDIRNYLTITGTYDLPGASLPSLAGRILGGWKMSSLFNYSSGEPFTVNNSFDRAGNITQIFGNQERPNVAPGASTNPISGTFAGCTQFPATPARPAGVKLGTPDMWFDPCAFQLQPAGFLGNLGRNTLQGPNLTTIDLGVTKTIPVTESNHFELRWEMFNIANRPNFSSPTSNVFQSATTINAANAGKITTTRTSSRQMQFALKYIF